jgi:hypothetical protein
VSHGPARPSSSDPRALHSCCRLPIRRRPAESQGTIPPAGRMNRGTPTHTCYPHSRPANGTFPDLLFSLCNASLLGARICRQSLLILEANWQQIVPALPRNPALTPPFETVGRPAADPHQSWLISLPFKMLFCDSMDPTVTPDASPPPMQGSYGTMV